jgi:alpha-tubulin suppressor-like RCC1 family protein
LSWTLVSVLALFWACSDAPPPPAASSVGVVDGGAPDDARAGGVDGGADAKSDASVTVTREPVSLALGARHSCVLLHDVAGSKESYTPYCWGANADGQLGASGTGFVRPTLPAGVELRAVASHASSDTTCSSAEDLAVVCWGKNDQSQCGRAPSATASPAKITSGIGMVAVRGDALHSGGASSCILQPSSIGVTVACWGSNASCELATSDAPCSPDAQAGPAVGASLASFLDPLAVAVGRSHGCLIASTAAPVVSCWGANEKGQVGSGAAVVSPPEPVQFQAASLLATAVAAGDAFSCAITAAKRAICWGDNTSGAVSDGAKAANTAPVEAFAGIDAVTVAAGAGVSCVVDSAGGARCRGAGDKGQLGRGVVVSDGSAGTVSGLSNVVDIAIGGGHACAITGPAGQRTVYCWGQNADGQVDPTRADKSPVLAPIQLTFPAGAP